MNTTISFMSANFVARQLDYRMTKGWMEGDAATQAYFKPLETFSERFDALLAEVADLGFTAIDLWGGHLHPDWATDGHIETARNLLEQRGFRVVSLATSLSGNPEGMQRLANIARGLGVRIIGGGCNAELLAGRRKELIDFLAQHDLIFGYENHPEKNPVEILDKIGPDDADGRIGVAVDTGWFGTHGFDAPEAIRALLARIVHVHLKDIRKPEKGEGPSLRDIGHESCALGDGVVDVRECVAVLKAGAYTGAISIEHEPEDRDPRPEVATSLSRLRSWLND